MKQIIITFSIIIILFKTGNVLSNNNIFNVNNIEISGNLSVNNQYFVNEAIKKGFNEMMNKVLLERDKNKLKNLKSNEIKDLVSYYQITETTEDRMTNKLKKKYKISGPYSADTIFLKNNRKNFDVSIGMYHDQVLTPMKTLFEYDAINVTIGLPFLRVSPDHGPNETMLGKNKSNYLSLLKSIKFLDF